MAMGSYGEIARGIWFDSDYYLGVDEARIDGRKNDEGVAEDLRRIIEFHDSGDIGQFELMAPADCMVEACDEDELRELYTDAVDIAIILSSMGSDAAGREYLDSANRGLDEAKEMLGL